MKQAASIKGPVAHGALFLRVLYCALSISVSPLYASFNSTQLTGARPLSMGGAYVAVSDDAHAVNVNPAGLKQLTATELGLSYSNIYGISDLSEGNVVFGIPWGYNSFGASYQRTSLGDIYKEETITASYARLLRQNISMGFNLKLLRLSVGNITAADISASNDSELGADIGLWAKPWEPFSLGIVLYDLNSPRLQVVSGSSGGKITPTLRTGLAYRPKPFVLFAGDIHTEKGMLKNLGDNYHFGSEILFARVIALRLGVDRNKFTGGIGFKQRWAVVDFAFLHNGDLGFLYRVSTTFRWGE